MNKKFLLPVAVFLLFGFTSMPGDQDGWVNLFDGKTTNGWHTYGKSAAGKAWDINDGALHLQAAAKHGYQTAGGGDLVTNEEYSDYHLMLDWKIAKDQNSGIIFYVNEDTSKYKQTWNTGLEMQVVDKNGHPDAKIFKHNAGDLYDLVPCSSDVAKGANEWNHVEIKSVKGKLDLYLNGTNVVSTTLWDDKWKDMVAHSKFKSMPGFGIYKQGRIALQDHGGEVWFKNIKIKKL
jgi:hypothetical protein